MQEQSAQRQILAQELPARSPPLRLIVDDERRILVGGIGCLKFDRIDIAQAESNGEFMPDHPLAAGIGHVEKGAGIPIPIFQIGSGQPLHGAAKGMMIAPSASAR